MTLIFLYCFLTNTVIMVAVNNSVIFETQQVCVLDTKVHYFISIIALNFAKTWQPVSSNSSNTDRERRMHVHFIFIADFVMHTPLF